MQNLAALVTALLLEPPLCFRCLAKKTGVTRTEIASVRGAIEGTLMIQLSERRCDGCGDTVDAVSLVRRSTPG